MTNATIRISSSRDPGQLSVASVYVDNCMLRSDRTSAISASAARHGLARYERRARWLQRRWRLSPRVVGVRTRSRAMDRIKDLRDVPTSNGI